MQVADGRSFHNPAERTPNTLVPAQLEPVNQKSELWVGTQISGDLGCSRFVDTGLGCLQGWVGDDELLLDLLPGECCLGEERYWHESSAYNRRPSARPHLPQCATPGGFRDVRIGMEREESHTKRRTIAVALASS